MHEEATSWNLLTCTAGGSTQQKKDFCRVLFTKDFNQIFTILHFTTSKMAHEHYYRTIYDVIDGK